MGTLGAELLVSADLPMVRCARPHAYKPVAERLDLGHQVCLAHVRKNVTRRLKAIAGWEAVREKLKGLLKELPLDGGKSWWVWRRRYGRSRS